MLNIKTSSRYFAAIFVASTLAACSGGHSSSVVPQIGDSSVARGQAAAPAGQQNQQSVSNEERNSKCQTGGKGIRITPCSVVFTLLDLQPVNVKVKTAKNATIGESDNCAQQGIAVIGGGDNHFTVTPGLLPGQCTATFTAKKGTHNLGTATLSVTNSN